MAVADTHRRHEVGRTLLTEIARRAQQAGRTFLALAPQDGEDTAGRGTFFRACGLAPIEPGASGAAWGCPVGQIPRCRCVGWTDEEESVTSCSGSAP
ncbi:GNAT family N-acetyltransferase [Streptomyces flaveolus]|uniref:hypothetical protein n=1 Tax=Streptomyces flaveolus TaxID=67297 RepID=UPI00380F3976